MAPTQLRTTLPLSVYDKGMELFKDRFIQGLGCDWTTMDYTPMFERKSMPSVSEWTTIVQKRINMEIGTPTNPLGESGLTIYGCARSAKIDRMWHSSWLNDMHYHFGEGVRWIKEKMFSSGIKEYSGPTLEEMMQFNWKDSI